MLSKISILIFVLKLSNKRLSQTLSPLYVTSTVLVATDIANVLIYMSYWLCFVLEITSKFCVADQRILSIAYDYHVTLYSGARWLRAL